MCILLADSHCGPAEPNTTLKSNHAPIKTLKSLLKKDFSTMAGIQKKGGKEVKERRCNSLELSKCLLNK